MTEALVESEAIVINIQSLALSGITALKIYVLDKDDDTPDNAIIVPFNDDLRLMFEYERTGHGIQDERSSEARTAKSPWDSIAQCLN